MESPWQHFNAMEVDAETRVTVFTLLDIGVLGVTSVLRSHAYIEKSPPKKIIFCNMTFQNKYFKRPQSLETTPH